MHDYDYREGVVCYINHVSRVVHEQSICAIIAEKRLTFTIAQFLLKRIDRVNTP